MPHEQPGQFVLHGGLYDRLHLNIDSFHLLPTCSPRTSPHETIAGIYFDAENLARAEVLELNLAIAGSTPVPLLAL